jgi:hypothetical protein
MKSKYKSFYGLQDAMRQGIIEDALLQSPARNIANNPNALFQNNN